MDKKRLTSENGKPIADNQNIQTADVRGPAMLQDVWYLEKLAHFDREVIPERRMHAKGSGAFGTFTVTHDITKYTRASIFSQVGKKTDCLRRSEKLLKISKVSYAWKTYRKHFSRSLDFVEIIPRPRLAPL